jgi:hypothetical protein
VRKEEAGVLSMGWEKLLKTCYQGEELHNNGCSYFDNLGSLDK